LEDGKQMLILNGELQEIKLACVYASKSHERMDKRRRDQMPLFFLSPFPFLTFVLFGIAQI
jgi:hypothetical protein